MCIVYIYIYATELFIQNGDKKIVIISIAPSKRCHPQKGKDRLFINLFFEFPSPCSFVRYALISPAKANLGRIRNLT